MLSMSLIWVLGVRYKRVDLTRKIYSRGSCGENRSKYVASGTEVEIRGDCVNQLLHIIGIQAGR